METGKPWTINGSPWRTEASFYSWVRGQLRKSWSRHPIKHLYIKQNRYKKESETGRMIWCMTCEQCDTPTKQTQIEIDHIVPAGSFKCKEDIQGFVERLYFITFDSIRAVCKSCHETLTHAEKKGMSFIEASIDKQVVYYMKKSSSDLRKFLNKLNYEYLTPKEANRENIRKIVIAELTGAPL